MLAAIIASQWLVALVSAAPTPNDNFPVNLDPELVKKYANSKNYQLAKCFVAKESKKCTHLNGHISETEDVMDFLARERLCDAITTTATTQPQLGKVKLSDIPIRAVCYMLTRKCDKITTANFRRKDFSVVSANALCYAKEDDCSEVSDDECYRGPTRVMHNRGCDLAIDSSLCKAYRAQKDQIDHSKILAPLGYRTKKHQSIKYWK
jgi:hypothetical protein